MLTIYTCIATAHDLRLVVLAAFICTLSSLTAIDLLHHARGTAGPMRHLWLAVSAISTGFGIWATHFVGMLAFSPDVASGYNIVLTLLSLVLAILLTGAGLAISLIPQFRAGPFFGGAVVALAIAAMHNTGMAAFDLKGTIAWNADYVAASVGFGLVFAAIALPVGLHDSRAISKVSGALLLTLAICSHHFTAMSAVTIIPDPIIAISELSIAPGWLAVGVALISLAILGLALAGSLIDIRDRRRSSIEADRMRAVATAAVEAERHIRYLARHDALTALPNRGSFNDHLIQQIAALPRHGQLAVLCLDLDQFKHVNEMFGQAAGDKVLMTVTSGIQALLGKGQIIARMGSDEFAILMPNLAGPADAGHFADRIIAMLHARDSALERGSVTASIGIALYPGDATDREVLLGCADTALARAKAEGGATWRFFESGMADEVRDRRLLERDLRHAIASQQMSLVYQPQESMIRGDVIGFEALLRWHHPLRGQVGPDIFIPVAEQTGSILDIGEWVLRTACRQAAGWTRPLTIAVNVSAVQIYHENFVSMVHEVLLETGLPAHRLELEITETALVRDLTRALAALRRVKALGVSIAMDDFGTGYSSLSNLRAFPFDKIKIDRSFIKSVNSNAQAAAIVRAVIGLGRGLGLPVLAEGVETEAELQFLIDEDCDEVQGYLLGRPAAIGSFDNVTGDVVAREPVARPRATARAG